jgi:hypothetical protein
VQQAFLSRVEEVCEPRRPSRSRYKTRQPRRPGRPRAGGPRRVARSSPGPVVSSSPPGHEPSIGARDGGLQAMTGSPTGRDGRFAPVREGSNKLLPGRTPFGKPPGRSISPDTSRLRNVKARLIDGKFKALPSSFGGQPELKGGGLVETSGTEPTVKEGEAVVETASRPLVRTSPEQAAVARRRIRLKRVRP